MKHVFLATLLCAGFVNAQNATVIQKQALFLTRDNGSPEKAATFGAFQCLFGTLTFIPAVLVARALKKHIAGSTEPDMKGAINEVSSELAFATVAGVVLTGISSFLWGQGLLTFAYAATAAIWNAPDLVPVKIDP